jgi:hypothetical protein
VPRRIIVKMHRLFDEARSLLQRLTNFFGWSDRLGLAVGGWVRDKWCNSKQPDLSAGTNSVSLAMRS